MSEVKEVTATCPEAASTMEVPSATRATGNSEWPHLLPLSRPSHVFIAQKFQFCPGLDPALAAGGE